MDIMDEVPRFKVRPIPEECKMPPIPRRALVAALKLAWPGLPGPNLAAVEIEQALLEVGCVVVPVEPTSEMWEAAKPHMDSPSSNRAWWDKMIEARNL